MKLMVRGNNTVCVIIVPIVSRPSVHCGIRKLVLEVTEAIEKGL